MLDAIDHSNNSPDLFNIFKMNDEAPQNSLIAFRTSVIAATVRSLKASLSDVVNEGSMDSVMY